MKLYANLHSHSTHSDGEYTPAELAKIAKDEGYGALAITDHDTATAYPELKAACEALGMESVFGCEFTAFCKEFNFNFHITAFGFDPEYPEMKEYLRKCSATLAHQTETLFERGKANGFISNEITWQDVLDYNKGITWLCNNHVFQTMKHMGLATDADYPAFFENVYHHHRREVPKLYEFLPMEEIISLVKAAGGIVILAHPYGNTDKIPRLVEYGIDGVEVWHSSLKDEERLAVLKLALEHNLYISGGSDHEGLCGGQYSRYEDPTKTRFYKPELSMGTTKFLYEEIRDMRKSQDRKDYIKELLKENEL